MRYAPSLLLLATLAGLAGADQPASQPVAFDALDCRWTFGNHEPLAMYRRAGRQVTGGIQGGALWLDDWHHWFDSDACTQVMQELGLNMLHSRFYKGLGWQHEARDFPNVKRFVANCHRHGIRALAYVQFSTLYYEVMRAEIPDLADWAAVDENGHKRTYQGAYYRWLPCINAPGFEPYLKKVIRIALTEGGFDGIMIDNCDAAACYCPRCERLFREHLARVPDPERRFGLPTVAYVTPPPVRRPEYGEIQDPICQEWIRFRCQRLAALYDRLYRDAKRCKPSAIFSGNVANIRRANMAGNAALSITDLGRCFDIFVSQSGNEPGLKGACIINRVREMRLAAALGVPILALSDSDAGISPQAEAKYALNLLENAVFGGIPTDRTVLRADRDMVSRPLVESRKVLLGRFNEAVRVQRAALKAPSYAPVQLLYSRESVMLSEQAFRSLLAAEEILLRNHVPYGLLPTDADRPLEIPADCQVLLVCDQACLSDAQVKSLLGYAERGRMVITGRSGEYDENYRQRRDSPLAGLQRRKGVVCRAEADAATIKSAGWTIQVAAPADSGRRLMADLASIWTPPLRVHAPDTVFAEVKQDAGRRYLHLLNYAPHPVRDGVTIEFRATGGGPQEAQFSAPMEGKASSTLASDSAAAGWRRVKLPAFVDYAVVELPAKP
jgi:hypothetical protein